MLTVRSVSVERGREQWRKESYGASRGRRKQADTLRKSNGEEVAWECSVSWGTKKTGAEGSKYGEESEQKAGMTGED